MASTTQSKWFTPSFVATIVGWALTILDFYLELLCKIMQKWNTEFNLLKRKTRHWKQRMKDADALRTTIQTQLAEIKTDLIWIRNELSTRKDD